MLRMDLFHYIMCSISSISLHIAFHFILLRIIFISLFVCNIFASEQSIMKGSINNETEDTNELHDNESWHGTHSWIMKGTINNERNNQ